MPMKVPRCKGMRDLLPEDMARFRRVETEFRSCCTGWGYQEIRTPTLEYLHLFTSAGTLSPEMLGRVYSFLDWDGWSGERVVLRPDGTIPTARLYVENYESLPIARLFYVENVFAFEGSGRESRERWQCGAELIGGRKPEGDVELISLGLETLAGLGIEPVEIRVAHAGLLRAFLEGLGLSGERKADIVDKVFAGDMGALSEAKGLKPDTTKQLQILFGTKGSSPRFVENLRSVMVPSVSGIESSLNELARIASLLSYLDLNYQIDFTSGRGFEYYTGIIFAFYGGGRRLGGGGRYDELIPVVGGKDVWASGFALYMDELMSMLEEPPRRERVLVKAKDAEGLKASLAVARALRDAGYTAEFDLGYTEAAGFRWVVDMRSDEGIELTDCSTGKKRRRSSAGELLKLIRGVRWE